MSNALAVRELYAPIEAACVAAWGLTKVYPEEPRTDVTPDMLPLAIVKWKPVTLSMSGQFSAAGRYSSVQQDHEFDVIYRAPFPADPEKSVAFEKVDRANEFMAALLTGPTLGAYGLLPQVTRVDPTDSARLAENLYEVTITVAVSAVSDHH